ncbi:MAG TPA: hypothetical protein VHH15_18575 [Actinophytocola sp.]|nr:hypothetical protein [Actinophytocola sp.]
MIENPRRVAIGVLADPGLPATLVDHLNETLDDDLRAAFGESVHWTVDTVHDPFEAMYPDYTQLRAKAREHVRDTVWDVVICVTDQPMRDESGVFVASLDAAARVAVISLPALGGFRPRHRLRATLVAIIAHLAAPSAGTAELRRRLPEPASHVLDAEPDSSNLNIIDPRRSAVSRLLAGMVRVNQPWRLLAGLSTALAGALTGIAFGLLYSSIWTLSTALGPIRLAGLIVVAVTALTVWIIAGHRLWERRDGRDVQVRLRNVSTVVTVTVGALAFFLTMFAISLGAVALVIPPDYLATTLGRAVDVTDYVVIAAMASVLGTLAGAVGSGLEDDTTVREATYGYREQERHRRVQQQADDGTGPTHPYRRN